MLRQKRRGTPSSSIARAATAGYRCRWHHRSRSHSRQSGNTARREQCSNCKQTRMNMACNTSRRRLDLSDLRRESEAAAETAENDSCKSQAPLHASEAALRAAKAGLRALDSLRRSSDRSSFPIAVLRVLFPLVFSSSMLAALVSLFHRSVANSFLYGDATGRIRPRYGLLFVVAEHVGCCCCYDASRAHVPGTTLIAAATHKRKKKDMKEPSAHADLCCDSCGDWPVSLFLIIVVHLQKIKSCILGLTTGMVSVISTRSIIYDQ